MIEAVRTLIGGSWLDSAKAHARAAPATTIGMSLAALHKEQEHQQSGQ